MPRRSWKIPFAASGDVESIPTAIQHDGSVSVQQGYGFDYERPTDGTDPLGKVYPRAPHNGLLNEITASIGEIQQNGFPIWAADMAPYPAGAWVRHDGKVLQNTIDSNSANPSATGSGWAATSSGGVQRFGASGTFVVPAGVTVVYLSGCGAGGGGGGGAGSSGSNGSGGGGGGGAGRSAIKEPLSVTPGQSITVVIGVGGAAGTSGSGNAGNGGRGGDTLVGNSTLAGGTGGEGGSTATGAGGAGGSPGGQWGGDAQNPSFGGNGGCGGSGPFGTGGGGGRAGNGLTVSTGTIAYGFGAGGAGGGANYAASSRPGSPGTAGMPGLVIFEW